ncbi:MAG: protein adenylyltransferase SelO family protein, partial [Pseudobdellovibrio sp.]
GQTPYSRSGDGRLTLKGAYRESLATELLTSLGVNTSQTLCFFETGEDLVRYDEPSPTRSAVLTRFTQGHIRIGTFQRLAFFNQIENIKKLTSYCLFFYYPEVYKKLDMENENKAAQEFLLQVTERSAKLVAQVMMAGFVHGVLNTDNINISGELFDYGPYRFIPEYDPSFTAAYFDQSGLYCFGRQPASFLWALQQLASSLKVAFPDLKSDNLDEIFSQYFNEHLQFYFLKRLNLKSLSDDKNLQLISYFFQMMQRSQIPFEQAFFDFHSKRALNTIAKVDFYYPFAADFLKHLGEFEVADPALAASAYFKNEKPVTLLIDEIESIWSSIEKEDNWSLYEEKLRHIRNFRGIY